MLNFFLEQCFRRWAEEKDSAHIANALKYLSAMAAVALKITYSKNSGAGWLALFFITSTIATVYQVYWDTVIDWGLLRRDSKNKWLRDDLLLKRKWVYFASMVPHIHTTSLFPHFKFRKDAAVNVLRIFSELDSLTGRAQLRTEHNWQVDWFYRSHYEYYLRNYPFVLEAGLVNLTSLISNEFACHCPRLQGLNIFLRLAWLQSMTHLTFGSLDSSVMDFIFAALEILRRGHWNFYRFFPNFLSHHSF